MMMKTKTFKGANVFMSRNLVPPEIFDTLHDALKHNGADVFLCCDPSRSAPNDYHIISSPDHVLLCSLSFLFFSFFLFLFSLQFLISMLQFSFAGEISGPQSQRLQFTWYGFSLYNDSVLGILFMSIQVVISELFLVKFLNLLEITI